MFWAGVSPLVLEILLTDGDWPGSLEHAELVLYHRSMPWPLNSICYSFNAQLIVGVIFSAVISVSFHCCQKRLAGLEGLEKWDFQFQWLRATLRPLFWAIVPRLPSQGRFQGQERYTNSYWQQEEIIWPSRQLHTSRGGNYTGLVPGRLFSNFHLFLLSKLFYSTDALQWALKEVSHFIWHSSIWLHRSVLTCILSLLVIVQRVNVEIFLPKYVWGV